MNLVTSSVPVVGLFKDYATGTQFDVVLGKPMLNNFSYLKNMIVTLDLTDSPTYYLCRDYIIPALQGVVNSMTKAQKEDQYTVCKATADSLASHQTEGVGAAQLGKSVHLKDKTLGVDQTKYLTAISGPEYMIAKGQNHQDLMTGEFTRTTLEQSLRGTAEYLQEEQDEDQKEWTELERVKLSTD